MRRASLTIDGVSVGDGRRTVVDGLSLPALRPSEMVALIGPNAAGETTLLRALAGLATYDGQVRPGEEDLSRLARSERVRRVTYRPQTPPTGSAFTVLESVIGALEATGGPSDGRLRSVEALARIGFLDQAGARLDLLSGGQRQLAGLAQAIVRDPDVLLLDEPTSALDLRHQRQVMRLVRDLASRQRLIVVLVLHDLALACRWSDGIAVLDRGKLAGFGRPADVIDADLSHAVYGVTATVRQTASGTVSIDEFDVLRAPAERGANFGSNGVAAPKAASSRAARCGCISVDGSNALSTSNSLSWAGRRG